MDRLWIVFLLLGSCVLGCDSSPRPVPVSGVVTLAGMPVVGAQVMFTPAKGRPAAGTTDEQGRFSLTTDNPADGAFPGEHQVTIVKMERVAGADANDPYARMENTLPAKYSKPGELSAKIQATGKNDVSFSLTE
jgi:hypothetical protein